MNIRGILEELENFKDEDKIRVSDGYFLRNEFGSDRGDYEDMYIGDSELESDKTIHTVFELKQLINNALIERVMYGYKGGRFYIDEWTIVTIGGYGYSGQHISDIREKNGIVYLVYEIMQEVWKDNN